MGTMEPYTFPCNIYELQSEIGEIYMAEEECPGIYYTPPHLSQFVVNSMSLCNSGAGIVNVS